MLPVFMIFVLFFSNVSPWTVNLEEVNKSYKENEVSTDDVTNVEDNLLDEQYANDLEYQRYEEKEVSSVIRNGSVYLEGLSKALTSYRHTLNNCSGVNTTSLDSSKDNNDIMAVCGTAANSSEYVQKLSELALVTTNQLRDKSYKDDERTENELLLQLAWLLDRLAYITGYEPNPRQYIDTEETSTTTERIVTEKVNTDSLEILEQIENGRPMSKLPPKETPTKSVQKRSVEPLGHIVNYYVKYKVWNATNSVDNSNDNGDFDVHNSLFVRPVSKRSVKEFFVRRFRKLKS